MTPVVQASFGIQCYKQYLIIYLQFYATIGLVIAGYVEVIDCFYISEIDHILVVFQF